MARVPYRDPGDLPDDRRDLVYAPATDEEAINVFRALANNPPVLDSFRKYFGVLWTEAGLSVRERQLVILTAARQTGAASMWHQHVRLSRAAGIEDREIRAVNAGDYAELPEPEPLLVRYAEAVVNDAVDETLQDLVDDAFDPATVVGVVMLATGYAGLALALSALDIELEDGFVGWALDGD
jgi:alkylhydroperoxidase family enzyme